MYIGRAFLPAFIFKIMWKYKLECRLGIFYYDSLEEARTDRESLGGIIFDRNGKQIY